MNLSQILIFLNFAVIFVGCLACLILIYIIVQKNIWNDFNRLIFIITVFEFIYFIFHIDNILILAHNDGVNGRSVSARSMNLVGEMASIGSYFFSAILSYSVTYLLYYKRILNLWKYKFFIGLLLVIAIMIWLPLAIYGIVKANQENKDKDDSLDYPTLNSGDESYLLSVKIIDFEKLVIIAFNIFSYPLNVHLINKMFDVSDVGSTIRNSSFNTNTVTSFILLANRLKWYPILEAFTIFPSIWLNYAFPKYKAVKEIFDKSDYFITLYVCSLLFKLFVPIGFLFLYCRISSIIIKCCTMHKNRIPSMLSFEAIKIDNKDNSSRKLHSESLQSRILTSERLSNESIEAYSEELDINNLNDENLEKAISSSVVLPLS